MIRKLTVTIERTDGVTQVFELDPRGSAVTMFDDDPDGQGMSFAGYILHVEETGEGPNPDQIPLFGGEE